MKQLYSTCKAQASNSRPICKWLCCGGLIAAAWLSMQTASAASLIDAYNQALHSDPTFKQAEITWLSSKAGVQLARSTLLPQISATGGFNYNYRHTDAFPSLKNPASPGLKFAETHGNWNSWNYELDLSQPLFNYSSWSLLKQSQYTAQAAEAAYNGAAQAMISNVIAAYFQVLQSYNKLHFDQATREADYQQFTTTQQQYKVGLKAIIDVYAAQAAYDNDVAMVIADQNQVSIDLESLSEITGVKYTSLNDIGKQVPLRRPSPANINQWVSKSKQQNYLLLADRATLLGDKKAISAAFAGHYPTLSLVGSTKGNTNSGFSSADARTLSGGKSGAQIGLGLAATLPIFSGGGVVAQTKQARYTYMNDLQQQEFDLRSTISQSRQAYLSVVQDIAKIKADNEAIISSSNALKATEAGYRVGTQTIYNVLSAISTLYQAQEQYHTDQYNYLQQVISLKQQAGILNVSDVKRINSLLTNSISLKEQQPAPLSSAKMTHKKKQVKHHKLHPVAPHKVHHHNPPLQNNDFTIQLFASQSLHSAQQFFHLQRQQHHLHLIQSSDTPHKVYYKVTYGSYPSYLVAKRAISKLPAHWHQFSPWIITFTRNDKNISIDTITQEAKVHSTHQEKAEHGQKTSHANPAKPKQDSDHSAMPSSAEGQNTDHAHSTQHNQNTLSAAPAASRPQGTGTMQQPHSQLDANANAPLATTAPTATANSMPNNANMPQATEPKNSDNGNNMGNGSSVDNSELQTNNPEQQINSKQLDQDAALNQDSALNQSIDDEAQRVTQNTTTDNNSSSDADTTNAAAGTKKSWDMPAGTADKSTATSQLQQSQSQSQNNMAQSAPAANQNQMPSNSQSAPAVSQNQIPNNNNSINTNQPTSTTNTMPATNNAGAPANQSPRSNNNQQSNTSALPRPNNTNNTQGKDSWSTSTYPAN